MHNKKIHGRENDSVEVVDAVPKSDVALREEAMLEFWTEHDIFMKSVETPAGSMPVGDFVFYDGPPFATGLPHYGHILAGTMKDAIPRFWTMNGYRVRRQWGWDCHGLPVENLIEKKLGLATKRDVEGYGIQNFNNVCQDSVLEYADDWRQIIPRMGRFVDMKNDYRTMDSSYTESVWWVFKQLHEKGLVFEGFKSMHLCPRCGTTLSNFEVNQGYKDIKDIAVTVKMPLLDEAGVPTDTSILIWTTTPWTLPGNMAVAVNQELDYVEVRVLKVATDPLVVGDNSSKSEHLIIAKGRLAQLGDQQYEVVKEMKGLDLVGRKYQPPYPWLDEQEGEGKEKAWTIYHADFVELGEEGTGAVHIAPAFGEDDMNLAKENGLPILHHVTESGHFKDFVTDFAGQLVKPKDDPNAEVSHLDADIEVVRSLKNKGLLIKKENITHSYPHCWRCDTPLLNYATTSWFVDVPQLKDRLVEANNGVNWVPEHVGKNRFGKWLDGARDWAVSRQRYWGAPLPIWKNPETGEHRIFGSLAELKEYVPKSGNQYLLMRHGEAESNLTVRVSASRDSHDPLTEKGHQQVLESAEMLKDKKIDLIIYSGFTRTKETARIVAETIGLSSEQMIEDERIIELQAGVDMEGKTWSDYQANFSDLEDSFVRKVEGRENRFDVVRRCGEFLHDIEKRYQNKNILIVAHASSLFGLQASAEGLSPEQSAVKKEQVSFMTNAEVQPLSFVPIPHNDDYVLDLHRPYIDEIVLEEKGVRLERVPDVFDCWFESGSMPYAQLHYPFDCGEEEFTKESFPAQFIAEGLDQTRGWFYSMLVLGVALFGKSPYENVIVNGLVLAEDGKKMSKSLRNYPDPMDLANRVGIDAMRFYLLSSPVIKAEDLNFSEKEVTELQRKNIGRLHNVLAMYNMYAEDTVADNKSDNVLDRWVIARLNQLMAEVTTGYKKYELDKATRPITDFIDDLSVWYLRRSRDRLKGEDTEDKTRALATLRYTLRTLALVMAPAMPFYAEYLWQQVKEEGDVESVHLGRWPEAGEVDEDLIQNMRRTREVVTSALEARTKAGIKVRQPLGNISVTSNEWLTNEFMIIIQDEVNVKSISFASGVEESTVLLDTRLTTELLAEGAVRELMRAVQERRKAEGLAPQDNIVLTIETDESGKSAIDNCRDQLLKTVGAVELLFATISGEPVLAGNFTFRFAIEKQ